jgi:hypothetical protein
VALNTGTLAASHFPIFNFPVLFGFMNCFRPRPAAVRFELAAPRFILQIPHVAITLEIKRMSREDKLPAMDALWDDLI